MKARLGIDVQRTVLTNNVTRCWFRITKTRWPYTWKKVIYHNGKYIAFRTMEEAKEFCRLYLAVRKGWTKDKNRVTI